MDVTRADSACAPGAGIIRIHPRLPLTSPNSMTGSEADDADRPWCPRLGLRTPVSSPTLQGAIVWDRGIFET